jgi:hypothetical protein
MRKRLLVLVLTMFAAGAATTAVAQPAAAATCPSAAYVHVRPLGGQPIVRWETDPVNGNPTTLNVDVPNDGSDHILYVAVGGGGLKLGNRPTWVFYRAGTPVGSMDGNPADTSCVAPDKTYGIAGSAGDSYLVKSSYRTGNSGRTITGQNLVTVNFG